MSHGSLATKGISIFESLLCRLIHWPQVEPAVQSLGEFQSADELDSIIPVIGRWADRLRALPSNTDASVAAQDLSVSDQNLPARERSHEAEVPLWRALETLLQLLRVPAMEHVLKAVPGLLDAILRPSSERWDPAVTLVPVD